MTEKPIQDDTQPYLVDYELIQPHRRKVIARSKAEAVAQVRAAAEHRGRGEYVRIVDVKAGA